jgi:hypothetical protein
VIALAQFPLSLRSSGSELLDRKWLAMMERMLPLCVPKIRFCNTGGEGRPESGVT